MFVREREVILMKKTFVLCTLLFALANNTVRATNDHDKAKIKAVAKQAEDCFAGRLVGTALTYGMIGLGFQGLGYGLQNIPGVLAPHYDQPSFGQLITIEPNKGKAPSVLKQCLSHAAYRFHQLGSLTHWPLRSVSDFGNGVILQTSRIYAIKQNECAEISLQNMKKLRRQAAVRTVPGMMTLTMPVFAYQAWEKSHN